MQFVIYCVITFSVFEVSLYNDPLSELMPSYIANLPPISPEEHGEARLV